MNELRPLCLIVDMDGTLSDTSKRQHHVQGKKKDFIAFYEEMDFDGCHPHIGTLVNKFHKDVKIIIVTGRPEKYRLRTEKWLSKFYINFDLMFMRPDGDFRQDYIIKEEILDNNILPKFIPWMALDDRHQVVNMWRRRGIPCLQVAEGDF